MLAAAAMAVPYLQDGDPPHVTIVGMPSVGVLPVLVIFRK
jgi:hypothetical protein